MRRLPSLLAVLVIAFGSVASFIGSEAVSAAPTFAIGDQVRVATDALNYRDAPGLDAAVVDVLTFGQRFTVADGPVNADGYPWYQVYPDAPGIGWVAGEFLTPA